MKSRSSDNHVTRECRIGNECMRSERYCPRASFTLMYRHRDGLNEVVAQRCHVLGLHEAFLQPEPIVHDERRGFIDREFEVGTKPAILPFTEPRLFWIFRPVEVGDGISLSVEHERQCVPWHVDRALAGFWLPIAGFAGLTDTVWTNKDCLIGGVGVDVVVRAE